MPTIDSSQVQWDAVDPAQVQWDEPKKEQGVAVNMATGALRGFNDIAGTLSKAVTSLLPESAIYKKQRETFDAFNKTMDDKADGSLAYRGSKLAGHIVGTAPVGGVVAAPLKALADAGYGARALAPLADAISSGGLRAGGVTGLPGIAARTAGGAINGAATAGVVDPNAVGMGAGIGAVLPNAMRGVGQGLQLLGSAVRGGTNLSPEVSAAMRAAQEAGYVIPPTQANPSLLNRMLEGLAGKQSTAQNAAARNQGVTNDLSAAALGLPKGTTLTPELLDQVRATAGKSYADISKLGAMDATGKVLPSVVQVAEARSPLMFGKTQSVDAGELVRSWRQSNADATAYFRSYARTADPETLTKARAAADAAKQIDTFMSDALEQGGNSSMMESLKAARKLIGKSYSVENAMNAATGTIDARKLAAQLQKGKPLSGELKQIAEFAGRFPQASKPPEMMGSLPGVSPLDWAAAGGIAAGVSNPLGLLTVAARPMARAAALGGPVQRGLLGSSVTGLDDPGLLGLLGARSLPLIATDR